LNVLIETIETFSPKLSAISLPDPGEFPIEALPSTAREYAEELSRVYRCPIELPALCILGTLSGALGKAWELFGAVDEKSNRGNIYLALGLETGSGKSIANRIAAPLLKAQDERQTRWETFELPGLLAERQLLEHEEKRCLKVAGSLDVEEFRELKRKIRALERRLAVSPDLVSGNATTSGFARELVRVDRETTWVFTAEGGEVFRVMLGLHRKEGCDFELWLSGYTGEHYKQTRVGVGGGVPDIVSLKSPCISALLLTQPSVLREVLSSKESQDRGLLPRILPIGIDCPWLPDDGELRKVRPEVEQAWEHLIGKILVLRFGAAESVQIPCSPEARLVFMELENEACYLGTGVYADFKGDLRRWRENACRLGLILGVSDNPQCMRLSAQTALNAAKLLRWCGVRGLESRAQGREERLISRADELMVALMRYDSDPTLRDLVRRNGFSPDEVRLLAAAFPSRFRVEERQTGGRPGHFVSLLAN
jgi:Protein of unknown function (DUF3987)